MKRPHAHFVRGGAQRPSGGRAAAEMTVSLGSRSLRSVWHSCTQMKPHEAQPPIAIARASGPWLRGVDGRRYLDAVSSWWVNLFGHGHPHIKAALADTTAA